MTLQQIKDTAAAYFSDTKARTSSDFTVNGIDLFLVAVNQARRQAEMQHDFEFSRLLAQVTVDGVTGGSLDTAVIYGTATAIVIGNVLDVGIVDDQGNLVPVEWTTTSESLIRQRQENRYRRDLSDLYVGTTIQHVLHGEGRVTFTGNQLFMWPKQAGKTFTIGIECYTQQGTDWVAGDLTGTPTPWATIGQQYLLWQSIIHLNLLFKSFVPRQEGNLPPPTQMAMDGIEALKMWDTLKFEQNRTHGR